MTSLQRPAEEPRVTVVLINPDATASTEPPAIPNSNNRRHRGARKHRAREVVHNLAKLCIPSALGGHRRWEAQSPQQAQLLDKGNSSEQAHMPEKHLGASQVAGITQRQLVTDSKPSRMQILCPRPHDSNPQKYELQQLQQLKQQKDCAGRPPLTELVSNTSAASGVYIVRAPLGRPVALKLSTDASSIERQYCVQSTVRGVFQHLQQLLKLAGVNLILPTIPACVALYPKLSSLPGDVVNSSSSCCGASQSLPLPVFCLSTYLTMNQGRRPRFPWNTSTRFMTIIQSISYAVT